MWYNTAINKEASRNYDVAETVYENGNIIAFVHDLNKGLCDLHKTAECMYMEPPWRAGYELFYKKAGIVPDFTWKQTMWNLKELILSFKKPVYVLGGKQMFKELGIKQFLSIYSNVHNESFLIGFVNTDAIDCKSIHDLITYLCSHFESICDPTCGGGMVLAIAKKHRTKCIASDINPYCIGYIANNYNNW
jgi:hypothetical protein